MNCIRFPFEKVQLDLYAVKSFLNITFLKIYFLVYGNLVCMMFMYHKGTVPVEARTYLLMNICSDRSGPGEMKTLTSTEQSQ